METSRLIAVISALMLAGCVNITPDARDVEGGAEFSGTVTVIYEEAPFDNNNIKVSYLPSEDGRTASLVIHRIKFVPKMPVTIDVTIPGIAIEDTGDGLLLSCGKVIPLALGGEYPKYTVTDLLGEIQDEVLEFSLKFGEYPTSFKGTLIPF